MISVTCLLASKSSEYLVVKILRNGIFVGVIDFFYDISKQVFKM